jgi:GH18 family chitinase
MGEYTHSCFDCFVYENKYTPATWRRTRYEKNYKDCKDGSWFYSDNEKKFISYDYCCDRHYKKNKNEFDKWDYKETWIGYSK